jgi:hypothetical protein
MENNIFVIVLDFGSNSNKYLFFYKDIKKHEFLIKDFVIHKISSIFNQKNNKSILKIILNYQKLLKFFFSKIKSNLNKFIKNNKNIEHFYIKSVGTEFYRNTDYQYYIKKIIDLNNQELQNLKLFLEKKYKKKVTLYNFEIITQEKESELVLKGVNKLINNVDNFILVDLGGASTEITIKKNNYINKILLNTGAVYFNNQIDLNNILNNRDIEDIENVILVGGSFVSLFFSLEKFKIFQKLNLLNKKIFLFLANLILYNNYYLPFNFFKLFLFNFLRRILLIEKIFNFLAKGLYIFLIFILIFLIFCFIWFLVFNINFKIYLLILSFILFSVILIVGIFFYIAFKIDDFLYNKIDNFLLNFHKNYVFFKEVKFYDIIEFYSFIKDKNSNEIETMFWDLKNRGDTIKNAFIFIITLLNIIKPINIYITNITLLEGLVFDILFSENTNIITK